MFTTIHYQNAFKFVFVNYNMIEKNKVILLIRDGWGYRKETNDNAIFDAGTPYTDELMEKYPNVLIKTSGVAVGLPEGYQGNSEVGHMTIGSGRIIYTPFERINNSIKDKSFFNNPMLINAINNCKKNKSTLHIIGLIQVEGVHSHIEHLFAILDLCKKENFSFVYIHAITDGRDSPVTDSLKNIGALVKKIKELGFGEIATLSGRYYAMDRDKRWNRTKIAYDCIVNGICDKEYTDVISGIKESHTNNITDEFIKPCKLKEYSGIKENDSIIFFNYRTDRPRQLTQAIVETDFPGFDRKPLNVYYVAMTQFYKPMNAYVAFNDISTNNLLGEIISKQGLKQLRISETEKYAHVTFFFNSQREEPYKNEDRILIPSPKVATYDLKPEMSVYEVADRLIEQINLDKYDFIVTNFVNGDMVGHTGVKEAILKAITSVDDCVGKVVKAGLDKNYIIMVFADHGNAEDQTIEWRTSHTINSVPFMLISNEGSLKNSRLRADGGLADIAPTVLSLMNIPIPKEMTGKSLILKHE